MDLVEMDGDKGMCRLWGQDYRLWRLWGQVKAPIKTGRR